MINICEERPRFNPNDHMTNLKGKDYLEIKWRLVWFREEHPTFGIHTEIIELDDKHAVFKAYITDLDGRKLSCGTGSESVKDFHEYIEKAETKAVGRALAMLGYGTQFAPELEEGSRIADAPVARNNTPARANNVDRATPTPEDVQPPKKLATVDQIEYIMQHASDQLYANAEHHFGKNLELMTFGQANAIIRKIEEENNNEVV